MRMPLSILRRAVTFNFARVGNLLERKISTPGIPYHIPQLIVW